MIQSTLCELLTATKGKPDRFASDDVVFTGVSIDSRTISAGELFWAVRGERHDGHSFLAEAFSRGATAAVCESRGGLPANAPTVLVENTLTALHDFARWHRLRCAVRIVGVTGSVGKTTTREMIHTILSQHLSGIRSPQNYNNHFGVPLTLLSIQPHDQFAVVEMGASACREIRNLAGIALPNIGVVTAIGPAHAEGFGDIERIARAKGELIESLPSNGVAVLNGDDRRVRRLGRHADGRVLFVGEGEDNDLIARGVASTNHRLTFQIENTPFELPVAGRHFITSALSAIAVAGEFGISLDESAESLARFQPIAGRCRVESIGSWTLIDDTYNSNPLSAAAACELLRHWNCDGRKWLVLGEMRELGVESSRWHHELGRNAIRDIDRLICTGQYAEEIARGAVESGLPSHCVEVATTPSIVIEELKQQIQPSDVVLIKGSRGERMEQIAAALRAGQPDHAGSTDSLTYQETISS